MEKLRKDIEDKYKWDLTKMIRDDQEFKDLCSEIELLAQKIKNMHGHITDDADSLYCYLINSELLNQKMEKAYVFANLYHYQDMQDKKGLEYKNAIEKIVEKIEVDLSFTASELMSAGYKKIQEFIKTDNRLEKYAFSLEKTFRYESHILSEKEEKIIAEATRAFGTPDEAFSQIDNTDIDLGFIKDEEGKKVELTNHNYIKYMTSNNRSVRKNAFKNMYNYFQKHINTLSKLYLGCIKEDFFSSNVRGFSNPLEQSLYADNIEKDFYYNFIEQIHKYLPLMYKYIKLRNKVLGYKSHMYDIYVDLKEVPNTNISYEEAIEHVKKALAPLKDNYLNDLDQAFTAGWIDAMPNKYKRSGAYQWGCYGSDPYVSTNFAGKIDDVSTLAHELGHAMHTYYSNKTQEYTYSSYPIFLAEIASTVNEVLVDDYFYKNANSDDEKIVYLQNFLDKVRTTIFRQTMFAEFEAMMHDKYENNVAITPKFLCDEYYKLNKLYYGPSMVIDDEIKYEWARIPHFYTPFYVYKYATGLISALSIAYDILNDNADACNKYLDFLKAGGSDYPLNILKKANVDITDNKTIYKAFSLFEQKLDELEQLVEKKELKDE